MGIGRSSMYTARIGYSTYSSVCDSSLLTLAHCVESYLLLQMSKSHASTNYTKSTGYYILIACPEIQANIRRVIQSEQIIPNECGSNFYYVSAKLSIALNRSVSDCFVKVWMILIIAAAWKVCKNLRLKGTSSKKFKRGGNIRYKLNAAIVYNLTDEKNVHTIAIDWCSTLNCDDVYYCDVHCPPPQNVNKMMICFSRWKQNKTI